MGAGGLVGDTAHIPDDGTAREAAPAGPITSTGSEISRDPPKDTFSSSQDSDGYPANFRGKHLRKFLAHLDISLPAPGPAVAYDEYGTCGEDDESALATSQIRGEPAPHGNRRTNE